MSILLVKLKKYSEIINCQAGASLRPCMLRKDSKLRSFKTMTLVLFGNQVLKDSRRFLGHRNSIGVFHIAVTDTENIIIET